jgi:acyl-homoserine lactone acylase PvdQ
MAVAMHGMLMGAAAMSVALSAVAQPALAQPAAAAPIKHGAVTIYRDAKGVPHIFGASSTAVMYGLGYAMAQDRLVQMELNRRTGQGRRAEVLGPSAVAADRTSRNRALAPDELMRMYAAIPKEHQLMMQSYVDGINLQIAQIARDPDHLTPYEFTQWGVKPTPWTLVDFLGYVASIPSGRAGYELQNQAFLNAMVARYGPKVGREIFDDVVPINDPDTPTVIPAGEDLAPPQPMPKGSPVLTGPVAAGVAALSGWQMPPAEVTAEASRCLVIGPKKSADGHVLMLEATADGPEAHLYGGGFDTAGFSFPAWGPPLMGRSLDHGWLMTSGHADTTDTYAEKLNPADKYQYWFKGAWRTMEHRTETILVKGAAPVTHEVAVSVHGPVIRWDVEHGVAYTQRYAERGHELDNWVAIVELARARSLAEFQQKGVAPMAWNLGICYGDSSGQFGFWETGLLPKRPDGADSRLPTPGTGEYEWTGFLNFNERPHMLNPKQGFIHVWNSKATSWMREGDDGRMGKTFRTWLGTELASSGTSLTLLDMEEISHKISEASGARDLTQTSPAFFAPYVKAGVAKSDDLEVKRAAALMLSFNGLYEDLDGDGKYDNAGLTIFRQWLKTAPDMIFGPDIGDWWTKIDEGRYEHYQTSLLLRALQGKEAGLPLQHDYFNGKDRDAVIVQTIRATIDKLKPQFPGADMADWRQPVFWKYLDPSRKTADKPALPGDPEPVRTSAALGYGPVAVKHNLGEEWTGLIDLSPTDHAFYSSIEAGGQNLFIDPAGKGNPNLTDQVMLHADNKLKRIDLAPEDIKRNAVSVTKLDD